MRIGKNVHTCHRNKYITLTCFAKVSISICSTLTPRRCEGFCTRTHSLIDAFTRSIEPYCQVSYKLNSYLFRKNGHSFHRDTNTRTFDLLHPHMFHHFDMGSRRRMHGSILKNIIIILHVFRKIRAIFTPRETVLR